MKRLGYTLIEILVVIGVLGFLMSQLLPALHKAKEQAQSAACQGNLKGYGLAMAMYLNDYDDRFCSPGTCLFNSTKPYSGESHIERYLGLRWCNGNLYLRDRPEYGGALVPYLVDTKSFICPTFSNVVKGGSNDPWYLAEGHKIGNYRPWYNYSMNGYLGRWWSAVQDTRVEACSQVKHPARTFCFAEESPLLDDRYNRYGINNTGMHAATDDQIDPWFRQVRGDPWAVIPGPSGVGQFVNLLAGFHHAPTGDLLGGKANCAFLDGHVASHSRMETFPLAWPHGK